MPLQNLCFLKESKSMDFVIEQRTMRRSSGRRLRETSCLGAWTTKFAQMMHSDTGLIGMGWDILQQNKIQTNTTKFAQLVGEPE